MKLVQCNQERDYYLLPWTLHLWTLDSNQSFSPALAEELVSTFKTDKKYDGQVLKCKSPLKNFQSATQVFIPIIQVNSPSYTCLSNYQKYATYDNRWPPKQLPISGRCQGNIDIFCHTARLDNIFSNICLLVWHAIWDLVR